MEPIIIDLNIKQVLTNPILLNDNIISEIFLKKMILRPYLQRIVFVTDKLDRVIIYEGEIEFEAHKDDSQELLLTRLLEIIDTKNTHA